MKAKCKVCGKVSGVVGLSVECYPCREKSRIFIRSKLIAEFLTWLKWYREKGFMVHKSLDREIEKWEKRQK